MVCVQVSVFGGLSLAFDYFDGPVDLFDAFSPLGSHSWALLTNQYKVRQFSLGNDANWIEGCPIQRQTMTLIGLLFYVEKGREWMDGAVGYIGLIELWNGCSETSTEITIGNCNQWRRIFTTNINEMQMTSDRIGDTQANQKFFRLSCSSRLALTKPLTKKNSPPWPLSSNQTIVAVTVLAEILTHNTLIAALPTVLTITTIIIIIITRTVT